MTREPLTSPKRAAGIELLGRYHGSGFKEPPYLMRRRDGQMIQLPRLLYLVAEQATGSQSYDEIAAAVGSAVERRVGADDIRFLAEEKLRPLGILTSEDGEDVERAPQANPMLALKLKTALVPRSVVQVLAALFSPLFFPPVVLAVLGTAAALDYWLFWEHGIAQGLRATLYQPGTLLLMLGLLVVSAAFHECGHAAATRYGGAEPGVMGAGLYIVWPAFYTDLTDAYRLGRGGRLRADLGGVYFNTIFMLATAAAYFVTGFEPLLVLIPLQHMEIAHQLLPFLRLDGYYIVSDLTGVPDMLSRLKPTLKSLLPGTAPDPRVQALKPWARGVVTLYVSLLVPVLLALFAMMVFAAPRVFATAWAAFGVTWQHLHAAVDRREALASLLSLIQLVVLVLSPVGLALTITAAVRRVFGAVWGWTEPRPRARAVVVAATSALATAFFVNWWLKDAYEPVAAGESGTLSAHVFDVRKSVEREPHKVRTPRGRRAPTSPRRSETYPSPTVGTAQRTPSTVPAQTTTTTRPRSSWAPPAGTETPLETTTTADTTTTLETTTTDTTTTP
jgi:putative peptide zinc metalloprotease protein